MGVVLQALCQDGKIVLKRPKLEKTGLKKRKF